MKKKLRAELLFPRDTRTNFTALNLLFIIVIVQLPIRIKKPFIFSNLHIQANPGLLFKF